LLDEQGLTKIYDEMMSRDYNYSKLTVDYWVEKIRMS
jgi:hypothetical protein